MAREKIVSSGYMWAYHADHADEKKNRSYIATEEPLPPLDFARDMRQISDDLRGRVRVLVLDNCITPGVGKIMAKTMGIA
jgi:hypothetical protein